MTTTIISNQILPGGQSQKIATSTVAASSTSLVGVSQVTLICDTNTFVRMGPPGSTVALNNGTDQMLLANQQYRIIPIISGYVLSFILATGTGNVYLTPEA